MLLKLRDLHAIEVGRWESVRFPVLFGSTVERDWRTLERTPTYHRWLTNVGVIAQKRA